MQHSLPDGKPPAHPPEQAMIITDLALSLETAQILEGQGIPPSHASPPLVAAAENIIGEAHALLDPAALYTIVSVRDFEH